MIKTLLNEKVISAVLFILVVLSGLVLFANQGFRYTYYHPRYILTISSENISSVIDSFSFRDGVSKVNRGRGQLELQEVQSTYVDSVVEELKAREDVSSVVISQKQEIISFGISQRLTAGLFGAALVVVAFIYYVAVAKMAKLNRRRAYLSFLLIFLGTYAGLFIVAGLLSATSIIYQLSELSFASLGLSGLWGVLLMYFALRAVEGESELPGVNRILNIGRVEILKLMRAGVIAWSFILIGLVLGLGVSFLVDALIIAEGLIIISASVYYLPMFIHKLITMSIKGAPAVKKSSKSDEGVKTQKKEKISSSSTKKVVAKSSSKFDSRKKGSKGKSKTRNRK